MSKRKSGMISNSIGFLGLILFVIGILTFGILAGIGEFTDAGGPYSGVVTYMMVPIVIVIGFILILIGAIRQLRQSGGGESNLPVINLNRAATRRTLVGITALAAIFVVLTAFGTWQAYEFTDSVTFCGELCHSVMNPQLVGYRHSPHARVPCVDCHVGPGAGFYVRSKLSGLYQVYATLADIYPRPIPGPIESLRPADETCEQCHWPRKFFGSQQRIFEHYLDDDEVTRWPITMLLKTGGAGPFQESGTGIHWSMLIRNNVEYVAADEKRQDIVWTRITDRSTGESKTFTRGDTDPNPPADEIRRLDCIDCHNRPSHIFPAPGTLVNEAISENMINADELPGIRQLAINLFNEDYSSSDAMFSKIDSALHDEYLNSPNSSPEQKELIRKTAAVLKDLIHRINFPEMNVKWDTYTNNLDHLRFKGCMRCHDDEMSTSSGETVSRDCTSCHTIIDQGVGNRRTHSVDGVPFEHPVDIGGAWQAMACMECHGA